jgi:hypothetical protein
VEELRPRCGVLSPAVVSTVESTYVDFGGPASCRSDCSEERGNCLDPGMCSMAGKYNAITNQSTLKIIIIQTIDAFISL